MRFELFIIHLGVLCLTRADHLQFITAVWRHGDRAPVFACQTDEHFSYWNSLGWKQLTKIGIEQHFKLGRRIREDYAEKTEFLSRIADRREVYVRSTDVDRTLMSASANLIGTFFNESDAKKEYDVDWPRGYKIIPIHTVLRSTDHLLNMFSVCNRKSWLWNETKKSKEFRNLMSSAQDMLNELSMLCNMTVDLENLWKLVDSYQIALSHNLSIPVNASMLKRMSKVDISVTNFGDGLDLKPANGVDFLHENIRLKGGLLLSKIVENFVKKTECDKNGLSGADNEKCRDMQKVKYHIYSAHDFTISALLVALDLHKILLNDSYAEFTATVLFELWNTMNGSAFKVYYYRNYSAPREDVTPMIKSCDILVGGKCLLAHFSQHLESIKVNDISKYCDIGSTTSRISFLNAVFVFFIWSLIIVL